MENTRALKEMVEKHESLKNDPVAKIGIICKSRL